MDKSAVAAAIDRAIAQGARCADPITGFGEDDNYIRCSSEVAADTEVLEDYLAALKSDADMALFDKRFASAPGGGGMSTSLSTVGKLLLAQAIKSNDVPGTVERFERYIRRNSTKVITVLAFAGLEVDRQVQLGPHVNLVEIKTIPPSIPRGSALGQGRFPMAQPVPLRFALTTEHEFGPVFSLPKTQEELTAIALANTAPVYALLEEAAGLLGIADAPVRMQMMWSQPQDILEMAGIFPSWRVGTGNAFPFHSRLDPAKAEALADAYFALDAAKRTKMLRIPIARLSQSLLELNPTDKVIDLGICLEALLLHDLPDDRGELSNRLSMRGAWLLGQSVDERLKTQSILKKAYNMRSRAVHTGELPPDKQTDADVISATAACRDLIKKMIELKCAVDWSRIVLGG